MALSLFPHAVTGRYKNAGWQSLGEELKSLLPEQEYDSAKATTYNALLHLADRHARHAWRPAPARRAARCDRAGTGVRDGETS